MRGSYRANTVIGIEIVGTSRGRVTFDAQLHQKWHGLHQSEGHNLQQVVAETQGSDAVCGAWNAQRGSKGEEEWEHWGMSDESGRIKAMRRCEDEADKKAKAGHETAR